MRDSFRYAKWIPPAAWCLLALAWPFSVFNYVDCTVDSPVSGGTVTFCIARGCLGCFYWKSDAPKGVEWAPRCWELCVPWVVGEFNNYAFEDNDGSVFHRQLECPIVVVLLLTAPIAFGSVTRFRYKLWMAIVWITVIAVACAFFLGP